MRVIIVDDEFPARVLLKEYAKKIPQIDLVGTFQNPLEALDFIQKQPVDLVFLDIQMPELTGLDFIKNLNKPPLIIFTTAYADYALDGYELAVVDYLLKPIAFNRFLKAVTKAGERLTEQAQPPIPEKKETILTIRADHKIYRLPAVDILYIEGMREYVRYHTTTGKIMSLESLKQLEEDLQPLGFIRVHKSFIVNTKKVTALNGNMLEINNTAIPIGKMYREEVMKALF